MPYQEPPPVLPMVPTTHPLPPQTPQHWLLSVQGDPVSRALVPGSEILISVNPDLDFWQRKDELNIRQTR